MEDTIYKLRVDTNNLCGTEKMCSSYRNYKRKIKKIAVRRLFVKRLEKNYSEVYQIHVQIFRKVFFLKESSKIT